jgi:hypothetical protein
MIEHKKGDFPLEIKVSLSVMSGKLLNISSFGGWIEPEDEELKRLKEIFDNAPDQLKFGDDYKKVLDINENGVRKLVYKNMTY